MKFAIVRTAFLSAILGLASFARADEAFEANWRAKNAKNPPGVICKLQTENGRTQFQQGEIIRVKASFAAQKPGVYKLNRFFQPRPSLLSFGTFWVSPSDGATDPLGELPVPSGWNFSGYVPPLEPLNEKPVEIPLVLNEWSRFDRPGRFQIYFSAPRILPFSAKEPTFFGSDQTATSDILEIEILPAAPTWAHAQVQNTKKQLENLDQNQWPLGEKWRKSAEILRYLNTRESALAMIERMGTDQKPRSAPVESRDYHFGLIGFSERAWAISQMEIALKQPDFAVTQSFLDTLETLRTLQNSPQKLPDATKNQTRFYEVKNRFLRADWLQIAALASKKSPKARAMTLHSLLEIAWIGQLSLDKNFQKRSDNLALQLAPIAHELPPLALDYLLSSDADWPKFRKFAKVQPLQKAQIRWKNDPNQPELRVLLRKRIGELTPLAQK